MKIVVFGANGMAGHMVSIYLKEQGHEVTGFVKKKNSFCNCIIGNALNQKDVRELFRTNYFDVAVNCIGILNKKVDANLSEGIYINSVLPHFITDCVKDLDTKVIHISSDCVFSGDKGQYQENSHKDAESYYGKTKALGEINDQKNLTFRTSIVGPELKADGVGLFHWFMSQTGFVNGFTEVAWSGVTTLELAKAVDAAIKQNITGLYHLVNNTFITKYDLLCLFNKYCNHSRTAIRENGSFFSDKSLINTRTDFKYTIPSYDSMVQEMALWITCHQDIYQYYRNK